MALVLCKHIHRLSNEIQREMSELNFNGVAKVNYLMFELI